MGVEIVEPGDQRRARQIMDPGAGGDGDQGVIADGGDPPVGHDHGLVVAHRGAGTVDQPDVPECHDRRVLDHELAGQR